MQRRMIVAAAVLAALLGGCGGGDDASGPQPLDFVVVDRSSLGGITAPKLVTARSDAEWQALWNEYKGVFGIPRPTVDFQSRIVVAIFVGTRSDGCYVVDIKRIVQNAGAIRVEYTDGRAAGAQACTQALTYPSEIVSISRSDLPVTFLKVDQ